MRFSDTEVRLLKNTFAERDDMLIALRKHFLQKEITENEAAMMKSSFTPEVLGVIRKVFLPTIDGNLPLNQEIDLMLTLQVTDKTPEEAYPHIAAREEVIDYLDNRLLALEGDDTEGRKTFDGFLNPLSEDFLPKYIGLLTRNTIFTHVEQQLTQINILAGQKEETEEEKAERVKKDSFK